MNKTNKFEKAIAATIIALGIVFIIVCSLYYRQVAALIMGGVLVIVGLFIYPYKEDENESNKNNRGLS